MNTKIAALSVEIKPLQAGNYALDKTTGMCYQVTTDTHQSLGRRQCVGLKFKKEPADSWWTHKKTWGGSRLRICESQLIPITKFEAAICNYAEHVYRAKQRRSELDRAMVAAHKLLLAHCGIKPSIVEARYSGS